MWFCLEKVGMCVCACLHHHSHEILVEQVLLLLSLIITLDIDIIDGRGISNKVYCERLSKKTKVINAVLAFHFIIRGQQLYFCNRPVHHKEKYVQKPYYVQAIKYKPLHLEHTIMMVYGFHHAYQLALFQMTSSHYACWGTLIFSSIETYGREILC